MTLCVFRFRPPEVHSERFSTSSVLLQLIFTKSSYILVLNGSFHISNINYPQVVWSDPEANKHPVNTEFFVDKNQ